MSFEGAKFTSYLLVIVFGSVIDPMLATLGVLGLLLSFRTCESCCRRYCGCRGE